MRSIEKKCGVLRVLYFCQVVIVLYCIALCCTVLHCIALCSVVLHCGINQGISEVSQGEGGWNPMEQGDNVEF